MDRPGAGPNYTMSSNWAGPFFGPDRSISNLKFSDEQISAHLGKWTMARNTILLKNSRASGFRKQLAEIVVCARPNTFLARHTKPYELFYLHRHFHLKRIATQK